MIDFSLMIRSFGLAFGSANRYRSQTMLQVLNMMNGLPADISGVSNAGLVEARK